ncbi:MAG TPA: hypothetical protein VFD42_02395 [Chloroflexota bacterium]|nr:hypothetical protein [Chloroflexota bacterium]
MFHGHGADLGRHVGWFLFAFVFYLAAVLLVLRRGGSGQGEGGRRWDLALILLAGLLFRAGLLLTTPSLSDDVFRYVWDGKLQNAGIPPYLYPPSAPEVAHLRGPLWEGINHKEMASPYPPLAELLFAGVYRLAPDSLTAMQVAALFFDVGVMLLLVPMLAKWGADTRRVLIYGWNPLVLVQYSHSAHYDAAMVLPLLGGLFLLSMGRRWASGAAVGLSALVKLVPAAAVPVFAPAWGPVGVAAMVAVSLAGLVPWLREPAALSGLLSEAGDARFNDSLGLLLLRAAGLVAPDPEPLARGAANLLLLGCSLYLGWRVLAGRRGWGEVLPAVYGLLGIFILLNPVVEPWYLAWIVPFLCFLLPSAPRRRALLTPELGWLLLSGLVILTDLTYDLGFSPSGWIWIRALEYGPLYLLLATRLWGTLNAPSPPVVSDS